MCQDGNSDDGDLWFAIFKSDILQSGHDIALYLNDVGDMPDMVSSSRGQSKGSVVKVAPYYKNLASSSTEAEMMLGDPPIVHLVRDIQDTYGHLFDLYYDPFQGKEIGLTWKPDVKGPFRMQVARCGYTHPVLGKEEDDEQLRVAVNVDEVVHELSRIGKGYIREIKLLA